MSVMIGYRFRTLPTAAMCLGLLLSPVHADSNGASGSPAHLGPPKQARNLQAQNGGRRLAVQNAVDNDGLDRIDQRFLPLTDTFIYNLSGAGVDIILLDTGVYAQHEELFPRVNGVLSQNFVVSEGGPLLNLTLTDPLGDGTFCASQAAGSVSGIAFNSRIISLRIIGREGFFERSDAIAAMQYAATLPNITGRRSVILFGGLFGEPPSVEFDAEVSRVVAAGIPFIAAAGNRELASQCPFTPSNNTGAYIVGSTNSSDKIANFSAAGSCIDLFAVGEGLVGAYINAPDDYVQWSGGFSSCLVAGVAATFLEAHPEWTPAQVYSALTAVATRGVIDFSSVPDPALRAATPNLLAYSVPGGRAELDRLLRSRL